MYTSQLHYFVQIWSHLASKNQDGNDRNAKLEASKQSSTNQFVGGFTLRLNFLSPLSSFPLYGSFIRFCHPVASWFSHHLFSLRYIRAMSMLLLNTHELCFLCLSDFTLRRLTPMPTKSRAPGRSTSSSYSSLDPADVPQPTARRQERPAADRCGLQVGRLLPGL